MDWEAETMKPVVTTYCPMCNDNDMGCDPESDGYLTSGEYVRCAHCEYFVQVHVNDELVSDRDTYEEPSSCTPGALEAALDR